MVRTPYRVELRRAYLVYMALMAIVLPAKNCRNFLDRLHTDMAVLLLIHNTRYLYTRNPVEKRPSIQLAWKYTQNPAKHRRFIQMLRVTPELFHTILELIGSHPVFTTRGNRPQLPVEMQLAVTLYWLGRYGNRASVFDVARMAGVSEGSKEIEKNWVERHSGCKGWRDGWVLFDGTIIPLFQKPGLNGDVYYTQKSNYGLNAQVFCLFRLRMYFLTYFFCNLDWKCPIQSSDRRLLAWNDRICPRCLCL
ncbi:hypothetical protein BOTBODRAFT_122327 [Botryobasidium botryosum FD-172 SS1]|uniref:DDE Tnp4 domain-containing protein n=1 Tax=Botryobasidium botryosum (strain FD-172 SS1) TaxID=930990 RepID=A0A067LU12_BOTB1|nr:hypothetical protein BOTBODRAFT_122327 [Botryobasidium botryosum FD-172 SS1]